MRVLIAINTLTSIDNFVYANHAQLYYRLGKLMEKEDDALLFHPYRMSIDRMRNTAAKMALSHDCEWLLFIDDDVQVPWDAFFRLASHDKDVIAGVTHIRGYPFHPMIFRVNEKRDRMNFVDDYAEKADEDKLLECDAVGFSCCLIKTSLIRKLSTPYFITGSNHTEDIYFCKKAKDEVPATRIWVDTTVQTAHKLGVEFIEQKNLKALQEYMESQGCKPEEEEGTRGDRTQEYLDENDIGIEDIESRLRVIEV